MSVIALMLGLATIAAQDQEENWQDARCAVALQAMSEKADQETAAAMVGTMLFYVGRLSARNSASDIESILDDAGNRVDAGQYQAIARECASRMKTLVGAS